MSRTRTEFIQRVMVYTCFLCVALIPFNVMRAKEYRDLVPGTDCKILDIQSCVPVLAKDVSYYDCRMSISCYNETMDVRVNLPIMPAVNSTYYNAYDDDMIYNLQRDFFAYTLIMVIVPYE